MTNSVFDRLAHQGTAASKARLAEEKEKEIREMQRRAEEAAAMIPRDNPAKLKHLRPSPIKSPRRTPKQQDAFFSRLAKQETASSAAHHIHDKKDSDGHHHAKSPGTHHSDEHSEVFTRLFKQETAASKAHHVKEDTKPPQAPKNVNHAPPPSLLKRLEHKKTNENNNHPLIAIEVNLHVRSKEEKAAGKDSYSSLTLSHADVRKQINLYHSGKVSAHALAFDIINAMFDRDFMPGPHWEIDSAHLDELDPLTDKSLLDAEVGEKFECFEAEKKAVWDWKDIYSVATAKATIKISREDIYVDEYSYYVAG